MFSESKYENSFSLRNLFMVIFKRKLTLLVVFLSVVAIGSIVSYLLPRIYQAKATILIKDDTEDEKAILFKNSAYRGIGQFDWVNSEVEILRSYPVAERVVQELQLSQVYFKNHSNKPNIDKIIFAKTVIRVREKFRVDVPRNSNVLEISYKTKDPLLAAEVVKSFINTYKTYRSEISEQSETHQFFEEQLKIENDKLQKLERQQSAYKKEKEMLSTEAQSEILRNKLNNYEQNLTRVRTQRIGLETKLSVVKEQRDRGQYLNIPTMDASNSPSREKHIAKLRGELLDFKLQKEKLEQKFTSQYVEVIEVTNLINVTQAIIENEIQQIIEMEEASIRALKAEEKEFQRLIAQITLEVKEFAQEEYEFAQLSRGIEENREVYSMLLKKKEESRISLAKLERGVRIRVISPPIVPIKPIFPKTYLFLIVSIFLGMVSGFFLITLQEYFDHSIKSSNDLEQLVGIPSLGTVREIELT
ncbi:GumC family protein [candidate division KSB1 bacterium]|nr:GumC family protein [candidate division KSB1 bacterium]